MKTFAQLRNFRLTCTTGTLVLAAVVLTLAATAQAEEKEQLKKHFGPQFAAFGRNSTTKIEILTGPEDVKMRNGQVPGKRWTATDGKYTFKLTIQDESGHKLEKLIEMLDKLPGPYMRACTAVSDEGEDGIAVYASLGGASAHGGQGYINIVPHAGALVVAHEAGHTLEQVARSKDETILDKWAQAIKTDNVSISDYGDSVCHEDVGEFAQLYAVCLGAGPEFLAELKTLSPARFGLWETMLNSPLHTAKTPSWAKVGEAQMAEAKRLGVPVAFENDVGMKFVLVPAGEFMMGSADDEPGRYPVEGPQHKVTVGKAFYVAIHQVTQAQWKSVMGTKPWEGKHSTKDDPANVATWVNWNDATNFCAELCEKDGRPYRLLTEAEWEYACRAGSTTRYCYGDDPELAELSEYAWYGNQGWREGEDKYVRPPGLKKPNAWGIYDVHGSVWEMCMDIARPDYEGAPTDGSAWMSGAPEDKEPSHSLRGGGSHSSDRRVRSASRYAYRQSASSHYVGFRVSCSLAP